jgi:hypothetical protein
MEALIPCLADNILPKCSRLMSSPAKSEFPEARASADGSSSGRIKTREFDGCLTARHIAGVVLKMDRDDKCFEARGIGEAFADLRFIYGPNLADPIASKWLVVELVDAPDDDQQQIEFQFPDGNTCFSKPYFFTTCPNLPTTGIIDIQDLQKGRNLKKLSVQRPVMKAFDFDSHLTNRYASFSRSFTGIRSEDLSYAIEAEYSAGRFWPDSLISLNPRYKAGASTAELVATGDLDEATGKISRFSSSQLRLHRHQAQSVAKAKAGQSYVVTTGTGSGKSFCFFVPIVDTIVRALGPFAGDLGYDGPPFGWVEDRRALLRDELDAFYARAYGLRRDELRYILDPADIKGPDYPSETFRVLKEKEIRHHGEYRTRRLVLEAWDRMEADGNFDTLDLRALATPSTSAGAGESGETLAF